jgi:hypothetical protein
LLVFARTLENNKGELRLADMAADLETVFRALGLSELIQCHENLEDALQRSIEVLASSARST